MTITLIGMPGSGKSCMGRAIANKLGMRNIDADRVIEKRIGRKLQDVINEDGLEHFKKLEEEILLTIEEDNLIVSTGGSAVYYDKVMKHFKSIGKVIYLYVSFETMLERIGDYSKRGIVMREDQTIRDLYNERAALYEKYADITINCDGKAYPRYQAEAVKAIKAAMNEK